MPFEGHHYRIALQNKLVGNEQIIAFLENLATHNGLIEVSFLGKQGTINYLEDRGLVLTIESESINVSEQEAATIWNSNSI